MLCSSRPYLALVVVTAGLALGAVGHAQPLGTDLLVSHANGNLVRLPPSGNATPIGRFSTSYLNMITVDADNHHVIGLAAGSGGQQVIRIDPRTAMVVATVWSGRPFTSTLAWLDVDQDGDYLVCQNGSSSGSIAPVFFKVKRDGSGVTTVYAGRTTELFNAFCVDRLSGDWLLGDFSAKSIIRLDRNHGTVTRIIRLGSSSLQGMVQDPQRPEVYVASGSSSSIISYHPGTHTVTTLYKGASSNSITVDRAPDQSAALIHLGLTSGVIERVSRAGVKVGPFGNSGSNAFGVVFDQSRNLASHLVTAPSHWHLLLSFPTSAGRPYVLALSLTGCTPGVPLPDGRVISLTVDSLTRLTAQGAIYPFLVGNVGTLNTAGRAVAVLNLNRLSLKGARIWATALTIEPGSPLGIGQISAPILLVL